MDTARSVAFNPDAPADERQAAMAELQAPIVQSAPVMSAATIAQMLEAGEFFNKAIAQNVVPFPGSNQGKRGMQSVRLDDRQLGLQGEYWEKPSAMSFESLRAMVDGTPVLSAIVLTRIRQVQRFCRVQEGGTGMGFTVRHIDREHTVTETEKESIELLNRFFTNCGWEFNPRKRKALRRDNLSGFMAKAVRDTLVLDALSIETEMKRDRKLGMDGFTVVDGSTIRLTPETGYRGDEDIFALQVIQGAIKTSYTFDDLIYEPRNLRSDVTVAGYGLGETELLVRVVTGFLNAMSLNISGFDKNAIPKGVLHLSGDYSDADLTAFRRYWNSMVKGVNSHWTVPVLVSKDQESKASFENFGIEFNEMMFSKWMTFLTSIICAIYGLSPAEINFDSFTAGNTSALAGSDTEEKLAASKDKGLLPVLSYFENVFTDFIVTDFSDKFVFRWTGLDEEDAQIKNERAKLILTVDEMRAEEGYDKMEGPLGGAPLNPALIGAWTQMQQPAQPGPDMNSAEQEGGQDAQDAGGDVQDGFGEGDQGGDFGQDQAQGDDDSEGEGEPFGKSLDCCSVEEFRKSDAYGVGVGDEVFYRHPQHGLGVGKVTAHGADGFTVAHETGDLGVEWDGYCGHKARKERSYIPVVKGEDGMLAKDAETGRHVYLHGELPDEGDNEDPGEVVAKAFS